MLGRKGMKGKLKLRRREGKDGVGKRDGVCLKWK